ncbi:glycoside hydrolase family 25 protein [Nocardia sp. NPDC088792]|uniref:glycoside hydrolase family 25 protein n=1 Tax=Nocardia sp. NPDC088792 TaxID=3364332 RepID=UPI0038052869
MTLYGIDISNNNSPTLNLNQVAQEGFSWAEAKVSEGDYFQDTTWPGYLSAAQAAGLPIIGYHYAIASCSPASQVRTFLGNAGGAQVMIDFEANSGTITDYWSLVDAFNAAGVQVVLSYLPAWYWQQIGEPDLSQVPGLVASNFPGGSGYASSIYLGAGGDAGPGWAPYGGSTPIIWQFTDSARVAGSSVDADAFRGSASELAAVLTGQTGGFMALTDAQQADLYSKVLDIWEQLRGPNGQGWPQLGQNAQGQNLTPVDALANLETEVSAVGQKIGD